MMATLPEGSEAIAPDVGHRGLHKTPDLQPGLERIERLDDFGGRRFRCREFAQRCFKIGHVLRGGRRFVEIVLQACHVAFHFGLPGDGFGAGGIGRFALCPGLVNGRRIAIAQGRNQGVLIFGPPTIGQRRMLNSSGSSL